ncbi:MAG TPA: hypothetical protein VJY12_01955 [Dysgonamonadaceae bacterium]|jgi:Spy/CpxP family protein refolding chaperone|nr:hypothetical protein [Dysgonamonadaceae bacterium]
MKKYLFLVTALLITMTMSMSAQNNNRQNGNNRRSTQMVRLTPQERVDLMAKELDLTAEQKTKVLALIEKQDKERLEQIEKQREQRNTGVQNSEARREEMRASRLKEVEKQNADLEKIIGKEKVAKWNESRRTTRESNRAGRVNP